MDPLPKSVSSQVHLWAVPTPEVLVTSGNTSAAVEEEVVVEEETEEEKGGHKLRSESFEGREGVGILLEQRGGGGGGSGGRG
jgi:hypothetical protein